MHLKYRYEIMEIEGLRVAVPMEDCGKDFGGMMKLGGSAGMIFELLQEETDEAAIAEAMSRRYDAPKEKIAADVHAFISRLSEKGLLE